MTENATENTPERAPGLLLVMMEIKPEREEEFNRWYNEEHVPERLAIPGFKQARRFKAVEGEPKYLALYEIENVEVLESPEYKFWTGEGQTPWTSSVLGDLTAFVRNVYVEILSVDA
tara:strand:+ start:391 stop:741 length:351 start_codon:yes stop_codon:yes gene_type:complete